MHATQALSQLVLLATMVSGLPQGTRTKPEAREVHKRASFDPQARCAEDRPAEDELMLLSYVGHNLAFDPEGGITSENGDRVAFLLDSACNRVINWGSYDALGVGKGFEAKMGMSYDGTGPELGWQVTIESRVISMGAGMGIADATIKINGEEKAKSCTGEKTKPEGLGVDHWKACNFKPGDVWPKPWWPNFSGFN
ncbi:hypothetical protein GCG54_00010588 [Colletotrichum gloeosporioides]|uniref:Ecp2 effector protein domain-containing protein n=1 Tax=Colletotrichum gloeosporioides TaxID=474922 RepID=A0A8H4FE20_COLGL|nr:uncharacterized protein GCG54_00010588 [Colletotrichum gloeosporioides]KAF3798917.1 hypothetical protein GCG54_00010588 [Colletotrichum gloeosporioides]